MEACASGWYIYIDIYDYINIYNINIHIYVFFCKANAFRRPIISQLAKRHEQALAQHIILPNGNQSASWSDGMPAAASNLGHAPDPIFIAIYPRKPWVLVRCLLPHVPAMVELWNYIP